jgi:hypothetical protein
LDVVGLALIGLFLYGFVARNLMQQGDLKTYLYAAHATLAGQDPYVPENLSAIAGRRVFPFVYPPIALLPFMAVSGIAPKLIAALWMWGKIAILGGLVLLWGRVFLRHVPLVIVGLLAVFGWNASAQWDLGAGNVAILEAGLIWIALACFVAGKRTLFAAFVLAAACFKLAPILLLALLLVPVRGAGPSVRHLAFASVAFAVLVLGPLVTGPAAGFRPFWIHVPDATGFGDSNPSLLGLLHVLLHAVGVQGPGADGIATALWAASVCALIAASLPVLRAATEAGDARRWAMIAVFLYVLVVPRPMAYGYFLLTPALLYLSPRPFDRGVGPLLLALVVSAQGLLRLTQIRSASPLVTYGPCLLTLCVWLLVLNAHSQRSGAPAGVRSELGVGDERTEARAA